MASKGRARPSFSPPRPKQQSGRKEKAAEPSSKINKSRKAEVSSKSSKAKPITTISEPRRRSRLISPTPSATDSQGDNDSELNDETLDDEHHVEDDEIDAGSPEPDYILAEVTTHDPVSTSSSASPSIPVPLIHRTLHSHFKSPDTTKMSGDARDLTGRYVDVFVREAIMRCAYEKTGTGVSGIAGASTNTVSGVDDGWLEVEDLEKVAVQLCLDF